MTTRCRTRRRINGLSQRSEKFLRISPFYIQADYAPFVYSEVEQRFRWASARRLRSAALDAHSVMGLVCPPAKAILPPGRKNRKGARCRATRLNCESGKQFVCDGFGERTIRRNLQSDAPGAARLRCPDELGEAGCAADCCAVFEAPRTNS
jgi:hypothetical protein